MNPAPTAVRETGASIIAYKWMEFEMFQNVEAAIEANSVALIESRVSGSGISFFCEYLRRRFADRNARRFRLNSDGGDAGTLGTRQLQALHGEIGNGPIQWGFLAHNVGKLRSELTRFVNANDIQVIIVDDAQHCAASFLDALHATLDECKISGRRFGVVLASSVKPTLTSSAGHRLNTRIQMRREVGALKESEALVALEQFLPEFKKLRAEKNANTPEIVGFIEELKKQTRFVFRSLDTFARVKRRFYAENKLTAKLVNEITERVEGAFALR